MEEEGDFDGRRAPRRRWLRVIAGGLVLGLVYAAIGNLLYPDRTPPLLKDISLRDPQAEAKLTSRLRTRFPPGTPETAVTLALTKEGFKVHYGSGQQGSARWEGSGAGLFCMKTAIISWDTLYGRITAWAGEPAISGKLWPICT